MHPRLTHWLLAYYWLDWGCRLKLPIKLSLSISQGATTQAQSNHKDSTKTWPILPHSHPSHLIKRGSQTACNRKLDYHDSCTLCKDSVLYSWVVISSLAKRLYKPSFCHSYTSFGVWPRDHYMLLQRPTTEVCHALLRFFTHSGPACSAEVSRTQWPLLHHVVQAVHIECHTDGSHRQGSSPLNRARHTAYSIPN
jgi:hypothetical protein